MTTWLFTTPTVEEGPASWEDMLFLRVKLTRGVSVQEYPQGTYRALRYPTQDEIAQATTFYMGGHEYLVTDATRAALIAAGVGITSANFTAQGGGDVAVTSVNGDPGPAVVLVYSQVGANKLIDVNSAYVTTGNITLPNVGSTWTAVTGLELSVAAAVGDYVEMTPAFMWQPNGSTFVDMAVISGASLVRYASTGTGTPSAANEGDPSLYAAPGTYRTSGTHFGFTVASGDLDTGNVRFVMANVGTGSTSVIYASSNYPFRWVAKNYGPVA